MNLHGLASQAVSMVNPFVTASVATSAGYTTAADGSQVPQFNPWQSVLLQFQPVSAGDVQLVDNLNAQPVKAKAYISMPVESVVRLTQQGGDLITINGQTWLTVGVLERWPDWCCVAMTLQIDR